MNFLDQQDNYDYEIDLWHIGSHGIRLDLEQIDHVIVEAVCESRKKMNKTVDLFFGIRIYINNTLRKTITLANFTSGGMMSKYGNDRVKNQFDFAISLVEFIAKQIEINNMSLYPSAYAHKIKKRITSNIGIVDLRVPSDFINDCAPPYKYAVEAVRFEEKQLQGSLSNQEPYIIDMD